ncbi:CinA family protein [uncultured Arthrobacter sp.]|uniref:CinA family protein n=1 Tax=uncultured Arthrobacter sp. TaxID=114050 RepID=UPI00260875C3|nr:CinA family protein [uncultured Arthrobacter sp.]
MPDCDCATANGKAIALAREQGLTVATGESLTAGMVAATLASVPGASAVLRGGVVSYHGDVKTSLLGVDPELIRRVGAVDPEVAGQMAQGARDACGADVGVATTGVAGPEPHEGKDVGTVVVAVVALSVRLVREYRFEGTRAQIREASCEAAVKLLTEALEREREGTNGVPQ